MCTHMSRQHAANCSQLWHAGCRSYACEFHCKPCKVFTFSKQGVQSLSSRASQMEPFLPPSSFTCGSTDQALMVSSVTPALVNALQYESLLHRTSNQFIRSQRASNGDADACTPLSPTLGCPGKPKAFQSS